MDPLRLCLALGPLAVYFAFMGAINLVRRPILLSGMRDTIALAVAVSGLVIIGPIELFMPQAAAVDFGVFVWAFLISFYVLVVTLLMLVAKPRLVIYNVSEEEFRPILAEVVRALDPDARWAGNSLVLPGLQIELHVESFTLMRNVSVVAIGELQSYQGWRRLETALGGVLRQVEVAPNPQGAGLLLVGLMMAATVFWQLASDPQAITQAFFDMLKL